MIQIIPSPHRRPRGSLPLNEALMGIGNVLRLSIPSWADTPKFQEALAAVSDTLCDGEWPFPKNSSKAETFGSTVIKSVCAKRGVEICGGYAHLVGIEVVSARKEFSHLVRTPKGPLMEPPNKEIAPGALLRRLLDVAGSEVYGIDAAVSSIIVLRTLVARANRAQSMGHQHRTCFASGSAIEDHVINLGKKLSQNGPGAVRDALKSLSQLAPTADSTPAGILALAVGRLALSLTRPGSLCRAHVDLQLQVLLHESLDIIEMGRFAEVIDVAIRNNSQIEGEWLAIQNSVGRVADGIVNEPGIYKLPDPERIRVATKFNAASHRITLLAEETIGEGDSFESKSPDNGRLSASDELDGIDRSIDALRQLHTDRAEHLQALSDAVRFVLEISPKDRLNWWCSGKSDDIALDMYTTIRKTDDSNLIIDVAWTALIAAYPHLEEAALRAP